MKKKLLAMLFFVGFIINTKAQAIIRETRMKKDALIVYDFNSKGIRDTIWQIRDISPDTIKYKRVSRLWYSRRATLQVNINPYLFDVVINARQVNDEGIIDSTAARLFASAVNTLSENKMLLDTAVKQSQQTPPAEPPKPSDSAVLLLFDAIQLNTAQKSSVTSMFQLYTDASIISDKITDNTLSANLFTGFRAGTKPYISLQNQLGKIKAENALYDDYIINRDAFRQTLDAFYIAMRNLESEYDIADYAAMLCLDEKKSQAGILNEIEQYLATENRDSLRQYINRLPGFLFGYKATVDSIYREVKNKYNILAESIKPLTYFTIKPQFDSTLKNNSDSVYINYNRVQPEVFVKSFTFMVRYFQNPNSFIHTCSPVLINKDTLIYTIEAKPSARFKSLIDKYGIKTDEARKFDYPIPVKGNFKVNFSVGGAFMFDKLKPKEYFFSSALENLPDDSSQVRLIEKKSKNTFVPAIAAYTHGYLKLGGWFTPAITIGLSTNPTDFSDASYFAGASLICGQQSRLIFTLGVAGSSVNVLKPRYDTGKTYYKVDFKNLQESDLTTKAFKSGFFIGVSYNLSSNR